MKFSGGELKFGDPPTLPTLYETCALKLGEFPLSSALYETCTLKLGDFPPLPSPVRNL